MIKELIGGNALIMTTNLTIGSTDVIVLAVLAVLLILVVRKVIGFFREE